MTDKTTIKKRMTAFLAACLFLAGLTGVTYAYNKDTTAEKTNTFTIGNVTTEIEEKLEINGTSIQKEPAVKNTGRNACYIRMRVSVSPGDAAVITGWNESDWKLEKDGFYYYQKVVEPGGKTTAIFTGADLKEGYSGDVEITCYQEAVQAEMTAENQTVSDMMAVWNAYDNEKPVWKTKQK